MADTHTTLPMPVIQPVEPKNIPDLLKNQKRWVPWRAGPHKSNGKFDKIPVDPQKGFNINGRDPVNWSTFEQAMDACSNGLADGTGFALSDQHPIIIDGVDFYVTVVDFDHCIAKVDEYRTLWRNLGQPYSEVSPSMEGLHFWGLTRSPLRGGNAGGGRELYSGGRFVTMTGIGIKGTFGECPGFASLEQSWFPVRGRQTNAVSAPPAIGVTDFPSNLIFGSSGNNWFDRLSPDDKSACLAAMLQVSDVVALADKSDGTPSPNWRTILAACVRSGAPDAHDLCRAWAETSTRFDPENFDLRWRSYASG